MSNEVKKCSACKNTNEISVKYCGICGGANFETPTSIESVEPRPTISTPSAPQLTEARSELSTSDHYLSAIALYLRVFWLLFLASLAGGITAGLGFLATALAGYSCDFNSCEKDTGLATFIVFVGGITTLALYVTAIISGFKATARVRGAESTIN